GQLPHVFLRAELGSDEVWLGQTVDYQVKLYLAGELQRGVLSEPELESALIQQKGADSNTVEVINGRRYRVIERHYGVTPQVAGSHQLKGSDFRAKSKPRSVLPQPVYAGTTDGGHAGA
ncbi:MAG: BatD family protein, partial [Methylococcales bacterium]|nr:BatD family protein [Methylococcales bacterium]